MMIANDTSIHKPPGHTYKAALRRSFFWCVKKRQRGRRKSRSPAIDEAARDDNPNWCQVLTKNQQTRTVFLNVQLWSELMKEATSYQLPATSFQLPVKAEIKLQRGVQGQWGKDGYRLSAIGRRQEVTSKSMRCAG